MVNSKAKCPINEVCLCFNGKLFRANTTKKTDSIRFDSYRSLIEPFAFRDVEIFVNNSDDLLPNLFFSKTVFERTLSNKIVLLPFKGYICKKTLKLILESKFVECVIFDFSCGLDLFNQTTMLILQQIQKKFENKNQKIMCFLLYQTINSYIQENHKISEFLKKKGIILQIGITNTALLQKLSMLLASKQEFESHEMIRSALDKNLVCENPNKLERIRSPEELQIFQIVQSLSFHLAQVPEKIKNKTLYKFEMFLIEKELKNLIIWSLKYGLMFSTGFDNQPSSLHIAVATKNSEFIGFLWNHGCDFSFVSPIYGNAAFFALKNNQYETLHFFKLKNVFPQADTYQIFEVLNSFY